MASVVPLREPALLTTTRLPKGSAVSDALRPAVPRLVDEMIDAIRAEIPAYDRPLRGLFGQRVRGSTTASVERFLALIAGEEHDMRRSSDLYVELGRNEVRSGRPIDTLLGAYRIGARVMWRGFAAEGQSKGIEPEVLYRLAEALFAYVDELSHESAEGYAEELAQRHGARERERERMLEVLMRRRPPADAVVVHAQAARAEWKLSEQVAPVATPAARMPARQLEHRLPDGSMAATLEGMTVALVPDLDTPGRTAELERALEGVPAARGAQVPSLEAAEEVERAVLAVALQQAGVLPATGLVDTGDHLVALILHRDPERARSLADRALEPLDRLSAGTKAKLTETLACWLDNACNTGDTARALHVHMQTLRYRLRQLEEVFGKERLQSGDKRLELQLALKVRRETR